MISKNKKIPFYQTWMTIVCDKKLKIIDIINPQHCMLLQKTADSLYGVNICDLEKITDSVNHEGAQIIKKNVIKAFEENRNVYFEYSTMHTDNTITYAVCYAEKFTDGLLYVNVIKIDEENIFEARDGFTNYVVNATMNNLSVGVYMRHINDDGEKKYILFNDVAKEFYESENILNSTHWNQNDEDIADEKTLALRDPLKIEKVLRDEKGTVKRWLVITKKKIKSRGKGDYIITTIVDITQRRHNEILLEQQYALLDSMYKYLPVGIVIYDKEGRLISLNEKDMEMFGIEKKEDVIGINIFDEPNTSSEIKSRLKAGENVEYELYYDFSVTSAYYFKTKQTGKRIFLIKSTIIRNKKGDPDGYLQICEDVTEKKKIEKSLKNKLNIIETIYNTIPVGIELYDKDGGLIEINNYDMQVMGVTDKKSVLGSNLFDDPNTPEDIKVATMKGENVNYTLEYDFDLAKDKYYNTKITGKKYMDVRTSIIHDNENNIEGYLLVSQDKTENVAREKLLEETAKKFSAMYNSMSNGVEMYDKNGILIDCNEADANIFGVVDKEDLIKSKISIYDNPNVSYDKLKSLLDGEFLSFNISYDFELIKKHNYYPTTKSGCIIIEVKFAPIYINNGEFIGYVAEINDITENVKKDIKLNNIQQELVLAMNAGKIAAWTYDISAKSFSTLYGNAIAGEKLLWDDNLKLMHPDDAIKLPRIFGSIIKGEKENDTMVLRYKSDDTKGGYRYYESSMIGVKENEILKSITGTQKDITDEILIKQQLEEAHQKSSLIIDNLISGMVYIDTDFNVIWENLKLLKDHPRVNGYQEGEKCYKTTLGRTSPCDNCIIEKVKATGKQSSITEIEKDGSVINITADMVKDHDNKIMGYICRLDDITESYNQKIQLERSKEELNLALEAGQVSAWTYDINSKTIHSIRDNDMAEESFTLQEFFSFLHPDDKSLQINMFRSLEEGYQNSASTTFRFMHPEGKYHHYECKMILKHLNGQKNSITGTLKDITNQIEYQQNLVKLKEEALSANQILNEIFDRVPGGMYIKDPSDNFKYLRANKIFCNIVKKDTADVIGKTDFDIFDEKSAKMFREYDIKLNNGEPMVSYSNIILDDDDKEYWQINKSIITTQDNNKIILGITTDVTTYHKFNEELKIAKEEAEKSDKLKSAFLANMSHEIRTPLNAIVGFSELLQTTDDNCEKSEYINIINQNNDLLLRLIGYILDLSKIESGFLDLKLEEFDMSATFNEIYASLKNRCKNPNVELLEVNPYKKCIVTLDKNRILQVITNFVNNAIKYTPSGEITMGYEYINKGIRLYVKDTGIGIPKDKQHLLFQRFAKLDNFAQGTGLGLAITKAIIDATGGKIGFTSKEGNGSTFWAWIQCDVIID